MSNQFLGLFLSEMSKYLTLDDQKEFQLNIKKSIFQINCLYRGAVPGLMLKMKKDIVDVFKPPFLLSENIFYPFVGPLKPDLKGALI